MLGNVEAVHGARQVQVAVRVEYPHELFCLRLQVGFDGKARSEALGHAGQRRLDCAVPHFRQPRAAKAAGPFRGRAIGDGAELARDAHARLRAAFVLGVLAIVPGRIAHHGFALHRAQRDRKWRGGRGAGDGNQPARAARRHGGKGHDHHAAQRRTHHGIQLLDAQRTRCFIAGARNVFHGQLRESPGARSCR